MTFLSEMERETGFVGRQLVRDRGIELHWACAAGTSVPHILIDGFLPEPILRICPDAFGSRRKGWSVRRAPGGKGGQQPRTPQDI